MTAPRRILLVACGALVRELRVVLASLDGVEVVLEVLPAPLHNRPERIPGAVAEIVDSRRGEFDQVLLGYADCGTGGLLDARIDQWTSEGGAPVVRLPGDHCYEFFAGSAAFAEIHAEELGTFFLTDYLARHADALVFGALGLDRHPQLRDTYFANYHRLVHLAQTEDDRLGALAAGVAERLGLSFERRYTGLRPFAEAVARPLTLGPIRRPDHRPADRPADRPAHRPVTGAST